MAEVHALSEAAQTWLLIPLQERYYSVLGDDNAPDGIAAQCIFTSDQNLDLEVAEGRFFRQFLNRINRRPEIPPSASRKENIAATLKLFICEALQNQELFNDISQKRDSGGIDYTSI